MVPIGEIRVREAGDLPLVRQLTHKLAQAAGLAIDNQARITITVTQAAECVFDYGGGVEVAFAIVERDGSRWLEATVREQPGARDREDSPAPGLPKADLLNWLEGLGMFVRSFVVISNAGQPLRVVVAKPLPGGDPKELEAAAAAWQDLVRAEAPLSKSDDMYQRNQALLLVLDDLRQKEADLQRKIAQVESLEQMRDELVHALVHDLRNPLASIRSSLSGLLYDQAAEMTAYQRAMVEISYQAAQKMSRLVANILDVHKLEQEELPISPARFEIAALFEELLHLQTPLAEEKGIRISLQAPASLPAIEADRELIGRTLQNLLDNAIKFTPENGRITVSAAAPAGTHDQAGPALILRVADSGPGITEEIRHHLFEKFTTGDRQGSGSGIGLAFCKLAVQSHGGEIWVENSPDQGATFAVMLPLTQNHRDRSEAYGRDDLAG